MSGSRSRCAGVIVGSLVLLATACQTENQSEPIEAQLARQKENRTLTVTGAGSGFGRVSAPAYGESGSLECDISAGSYDPSLCSKSYGWKTPVELTATPNSGSTFTGWSGSCTGTTPTCKVMMTQSRSVQASFTGTGVPKFTLTVTGGGTGNGTVRSQTGLSPAISCTITAGSATGTGCSASYNQGTSVVLSQTPASGHTFAGWTGACSGTGSCTISMSTNKSATARYNAPPGIEAQYGKWDASQPTPNVIAIHLNMMPNGKLLLWGHAGEPQLWQGPGAGFTQISYSGCTAANSCDLFCAGHTFLANGRLLVAGGHNETLGDQNGVTQASTFDGSTWQPAGQMTYGRWYPTLTTLANGDVLTLSGTMSPNVLATIAERYNTASNSWSVLTGVNVSIPMYPRAFVEPKNGLVFVAGESTPRFINPSGTGSYTTAPARRVSDRNYAPAVMLDSKVMYIGGGGASGCPTNLPRRSVEVIDLAAATPVWTLIDSLDIGRRHHVATILADGSVLVTGGTSQCGFTNEAGAVYMAELYNPATGQWSQMANASVVRVYHSTSALLSDGRVALMGSGEGGGATLQYNYQIYSPPYLFKGIRPTYSLGSPNMHYGQSFTVTTPDAGQIRKVTLIRLSSSTHAFDMGQRLNTLAFTPTADGQALTVTAPAAGRIAPPGPYFLFIINETGVPSVAQVVMLGP